MSALSERLHHQKEGHLKRALGVPSLVLFGLVYMVPLTVFTTYGFVTQLSGGRVAAAYLVTLLAMVFTARSYARMSVAYPVAGSAYVYTQKTFGAPIGFLSGWSLLLDYLFLPMINYLVIGLYMHEAIPSVPPWVFILVAILLVTVLNVIGIVSVARANIVIIAMQVVFIVVFVVLSIATITGSGVDLLAPLRGDGTEVGFAPVLAGAAVLCLSFLGFDSVSTMSEEAKHPLKDVPRAIMLTTVGAGIIFFGLSYVAQLAYPSNEFGHVDTAAVDVMASVGGGFLTVFFTAAYVAGCIGSALTSQASVARILFAMGRDGVMPRPIFGHISPRFGTPVYAVLIVSAFSLIALVIDLVLLAAMISFGALVAFSAVNLSAFKHYYIDLGQRSGLQVINSAVLPLIGVALTLWLWTSLEGRSLQIGLAWLAAGVIYLAIRTRGFRRPTPVLDMAE